MKRSSQLRAGLGRLAVPVAIAALIAPLAPSVTPALAVPIGPTLTMSTASMDATTAADAPGHAWTTIPDITLQETGAGQVLAGTITLTIPTTDFQYNKSVGTVTLTGTGCDMALASPNLSYAAGNAQNVSVTITSPSNAAACLITWHGLQVQPTHASLSGAQSLVKYITNTGGTGPSGSTNRYAELDEVPGPATGLAFTTQPAFGIGTTAGTSGSAFQTQPAVAVVDAVGNRVWTAANADVTLGIDTKPGGSPVLACTNNTVTTSSGLATFSGCKINLSGIGYKLSATSGTWTAPPSALFDVVDRISFATQPAGARGGIAFTTQPVVKLTAGTGTTPPTAVNTNIAAVTLSIAGSTVSGGTLTCTTNPVTVAAGVATFAGCMIDKVGTYTLQAASGGLTVISSAVAVTAGLATKVAFVQQPAGANAGSAFTTQPIVAIVDGGGNIVTTGVTANITLSIGTNPSTPAGVLTCTPALTMATASTGTAAGQAAFAGCAISNAGIGYTLIATPTSVVCATNACAVSGSLTAATSAAFTVNAPTAKITLTTSASTITWASTVYLRTHFGINGAFKTFNLEASRDGVSWGVIATRMTDSSGNDIFAYRPATNLYYRVNFAGSADLSAAISDKTRVVNRQIAILRPTNFGSIKSIHSGTKVTFTATVRPIGPDLPKALVTFRFYKYVSGHWIVLTHRDVYIDANGKASYTWKFSSGQWYVRAMANPTPYNANSVWTPIERYSVH